MRLIRKLSFGGMTTPCMILNNELQLHQKVCNQLSRRISTRRMVTTECTSAPVAKQSVQPSTSATLSKLVPNALPLLAIRLKNTIVNHSSSVPSFTRSSNNHSNGTQQSRNCPNATQISSHRQLSTSSQSNQPKGPDEFLPDSYEKPYGTHTSTGAVLDPPVTNKMGVIWAIAVVIPAVYLGGMLSTWMASTLNKYNIFVVDDDDDDDDDWAYSWWTNDWMKKMGNEWWN